MTLNLTSDLVSWNWCISQIIFEIGIPNLVCKCILECLSVTNHFWVTVNMTSDLVFKNYCVQSISPILFDVGIPNLGWWFLLGWRSGAYHFESLWPWHWLLASFLGFSCYITAYFLQMCLMLDQFFWGIRHVFVTFLVSIWNAFYRLHCEIWIWFHSCLFEFFISTVNTLTMCTCDAGPEQSLVLFTVRSKYQCVFLYDMDNI